MTVLIVGNAGGTNVGASLLRGARALGLDAHLVESAAAMDAPDWLRQLNWRLRGRRPTWLGRFSHGLVEAMSRMRPAVLVTTGFAPCDRRALEATGAAGIKRLSYLTDDPFNPSLRAPWFLDVLPLYDHVFSPRRANMRDLLGLGCRRVSYLPFAYEPELQYPASSRVGDDGERFASDVIFAGGADCDRRPYVAALIRAGFRVALYGDYWERFGETRRHARGHADPATLRTATRCAKVALCLVRRANRDGHVMRSFEIPAIGGSCMLAEDTEEHREIFGADGHAVMFFRAVGEMVGKVGWLLEHDEERRRLAEAAHCLVVGGPNTYRDRLAAMLQPDGAGTA